MTEIFDPEFFSSIARLTTPILLAALGGSICHRAGIFNIGLEGFILLGAFMAVLGSFFANSAFIGALTAVFGGLFLSIIFAEFHLRRKGDPIVISIAINILALGLSTYLLRSIFKVSGVFSHPEIEDWRTRNKGIGYFDEETNFFLYGLLDDVWINTKTDQLIVVDYCLLYTSPSPRD